MKRRLLLIPLVALTGRALAAPDPAALEFFEKKVRPVLVDNCYNCHSANTNAKGGLRVDDIGGLRAGGDSGAAIVPGNADKSLLIKAVRYASEDLQMPPKKKLTPAQVADLAQWVQDGAAWPQLEAVAVNKPNEKYDKLRKEHWAWQPLKAAAAPAVKDATWPRTNVDRFILAALEAKNLKPVRDADKLSLIRRVTFDLTGLPPTPEQVDAFVNDASADAFVKVVDRLLASPQFGERWGRHWLDVARYGESTGSSRNVPYPHAWRYRDYVIDAFNADKPYDAFVREQIAGDLLPATEAKSRDEHLVATGFLALGVKDVNQRFKVRFVMDNVDEQIDTVTRSTLALTASCARCHDHKFDPIPQADYYGLAGIFRSTDECAGVRNKMGGGGMDYYDTAMLLPLGDRKAPAEASAAEKAKIEALTKDAKDARAAFRAIRGKPEGTKRGADGFPAQRALRLKAEALEAELAGYTDPAATGPVALGVRDAQEIGDTEIRIRGEAEKLGPVVPRGFLSVVTVPDAPAVNAKQSGRLELAQWITSPQNPLTPRVRVNRIWQDLFGRGIVQSVDNFGVTGDLPSHPELLDALAAQFVRDGWSTKKLVRSIVLSRTYGLSSDESNDALAIDPSDRLVWRHAPRRLEAEEIRDATLAASGKLDAGRPQASPAKDLRVMELPNNGPLARKLGDAAAASTARSIYLPLLRGLAPESLAVFDFAEQGMVTGTRDATTVATQALYLLNDPFVRRQSLSLADRLLNQPGADDDVRVALAYRLTLGRPATTDEVERAKQYLADYEPVARQVLSAPVKPRPAAPKVQPASQPAAPKQAVSADELEQPDAPVTEDVIVPPDARHAAWASFVQALIGSTEFRYLR